MRKFFAGVAATIIGGLILFVLTDFYQSWRKASEKSVSVSIDTSVAELSEEALRDIKFDRSRSVRIDKIRVENTGSRPLIDSPIYFSSTTSAEMRTQAWGMLKDSDSTGAVSMASDQNGFTLNIRALQPNEGINLWVASDCCAILTASTRTPDLYISQSNSGFGFELPLAFKVAVGVCVLVVAFLLGAVVETSIVTARLKKRGIDLVATLNRPAGEGDINNG